MDVIVHPFRYLPKESRLFHHTYGEHDAHHIEYLLDGLILQGAGHSRLEHLVGCHQLAVEHFIDHPQDGEYAECAKERAQFGDIMESGDKP